MALPSFSLIIAIIFLFLSPLSFADTGVCSSLVLSKGYYCEEFDVKTQDGYILKLHRIPAGRGGAAVQNSPPVLLQHGVVADGVTWLLNPPEEALAFVLADAGFDVWIANTRGTRWSRRHETLHPSSRAFWSWSWDELAAYDLPATVDFIFNKTGQKLHYIGHSMGTLTALAALSEGRLVSKMNSAALMSPIAFLSHMKTQLGILAAKIFLGEVYTWLGIAEFDPVGAPVKYLMRTLCQNPTVNCYDLFSDFTGSNCCLNKSTVEIYLKYEPQSTSTKTMVHLAQNFSAFRDGILTKFDYGEKVNLRRYGQSTPPPYNLSNIPKDFPLLLSYGGEDKLSDVEDVGLLVNELKVNGRNSTVSVQYIESFAHADFVMGTAAKVIVYDAIIDFFRNQM